MNRIVASLALAVCCLSTSAFAAGAPLKSLAVCRKVAASSGYATIVTFQSIAAAADLKVGGSISAFGTCAMGNQPPTLSKTFVGNADARAMTKYVNMLTAMCKAPAYTTFDFDGKMNKNTGSSLCK